MKKHLTFCLKHIIHLYAVMLMNYLYDVQNETDIVTVLTVTPEFKYKGENLIYEKIIGAKAV